MYGEQKLSDHYILRYGWSKEFVEAFSSLQCEQIEIPATLIRSFHIYIRRYVNSALTGKRKPIMKLQRKHRLFTVLDAQKALQRNPPCELHLCKEQERMGIIMPGIYAAFAIEKFPRSNVFLINGNANDKKALAKQKLPTQYKVIDLDRAVKRFPVPAVKMKKILRKASRLQRANKKHPIFGHPHFKKWLLKQIPYSVKMILFLQRLLLKQPIGVIVDYTEIVNPGTTLSLLAVKYRIPFIYIPPLPFMDRSFLPTRASHYFLWGKNYKDWVAIRGVPESKIIITGNLNFEYIQRKQANSKSRFTRYVKIPSHHYIVTYTTQWFTDVKVHQTVVSWIKQAVVSLPVTVLIRPHPRVRFDYSKAIRGSTQIHLCPSKVSLHDILKHSDVVMTISSTTAIEAALYEKGIIVLQPKMMYHYEHHNNTFNAHLVHAKAGPAIYRASDLRNVFHNLTSDKQYQTLLKKNSLRFLRNTLSNRKPPSELVQIGIEQILKGGRECNEYRSSL